MRKAVWLSVLLAATAPLDLAAPAWAEEPTSSSLARDALDACRGDAHREKMLVHWAAIDEEVPPDGTEVIIVQGYISYSITQLLLRDGKIEARSVYASRSSWHNRKGESFGASTFDVSPARFAAAWNAMRRLLAASDERTAPAPEGHPWGGSSMSSTHESADWIRARRPADASPLHCAERAPHDYDWDDVRRWEGLRDQAIFEIFEALLPAWGENRRPAPISPWEDFAAVEIRTARGLDVEQAGRDREFLATCLRILGEVGDEASEGHVAAFDSALYDLDGSDWEVLCLREEAARTATRLRVRLHWDREEVKRLLRTLPGGTWTSEDQGRWLAEQFRIQDPVGWAAFLVEETTRDDARANDVAVAAGRLRDLPAEQAVPILHDLLGHDDPDVRLEAALALHDVAPEDPAAGAATVALALDRSIACDWRADLTDRWCRNRALAAALEWGGLTPSALRAHLLAPEKEQPELVAAAQRHLATLPEALTGPEAERVWGPILDAGSGPETLAAVCHLVAAGCGSMKPRILAALDRIAAEGSVSPRKVALWRQLAEDLRPDAGEEE